MGGNHRRDFLKLKHAIPSHDTFSEIFRVIDPKALDAAFGKVLADVAALLKEGDVIPIDGKRAGWDEAFLRSVLNGL